MAREERPEDGRSRRRSRGGEPTEVPREETGWLDDLRTAKEQRGAIGPGTPAGETRPRKSGRLAPGPDAAPDDNMPFGTGTPAFAHSRSTKATSSLSRGRTTARASPR